MRIDRDTLLPMLAHVASCADAKNSDGVTGHLRLDATDSTITATGTDYEVSGTATAPCDGDGEWSVCVPARLLRLAQALPEGATVTLTPRDNERLAVEAGRARYEMATLPADQFPEVPDPALGGVPLDSTALRRLLALSAYCVSTDDGRPAITGVYLEGKDGTLRATATDGHRLATATMPADGLTIDAIMHRRGLDSLRALLDGGPTVWLDQLGRNLTWRTRYHTLTCRQIEANYPDWRKVVPDVADGYALRATFPAEALLAELSRVAPMLPRGDAILLLTWTDTGLMLDCRSDHGEAHAEMDADVAGNGQVIGLNPAYLRDAVRALGGTVTLAVRDTVSPVLVSSDAATAVGVCMPCRL